MDLFLCVFGRLFSSVEAGRALLDFCSALFACSGRVSRNVAWDLPPLGWDDMPPIAPRSSEAVP